MHADGTPSAEDKRSAAIAEAAARWLARRDRGLSPDECLEFQRWNVADPRHEAELRRLEQSWHQFDRAAVVPELVALAGELDRVTRLREQNEVSLRRRRLVAAAAAIALVAGVTWWQLGPGDDAGSRFGTDAYQVIASSARHVELADGSEAQVRDDGQIQTSFSPGERRVDLVRGEAHFTVAHDPDRPFVVQAGDFVVRAVGTAFNVRLDAGRVDILVTEGTVEVSESSRDGLERMGSPASVVAGQRAVVERSPPPGTARTPKLEVITAGPAEVEQVLAWQSTRLVFDRTPLADAVEAFNRHDSGGPAGTLVIGDDALRTRRIGGTFRAANVEGFVRLLERGGEVRAVRRNHEIVLLRVP